MTELEQIQKDLELLKERNKRVDANKAWETSMFRKVLIAVLTYIVVVIFFVAAGFERPLLSAIVPTIGFVFSTLTIPFFKQWWLAKRKQNNQ